MIDLSVTICGVKFQNPVMPASGTYEISDTDENIVDPRKLGALINKTVFLGARNGNPPPRIWETPCGMLNSIGIPSEGIHDFVACKLPFLRSLGPPIVVSIAGNTKDEFCKVAEIIDQTNQADLLELDLSCPNIHGGTQWAVDKKDLHQVISAVQKFTELPIIAKLSPMVADIGEMALCAQEAGAGAVSMVNTFKAMAIDIQRRKPILGNVMGGLSGPAIRPIAIAAVFSAYKRIDIPIIGIGGISSWQDAIEYLLAGASVIAVGMYNFVNPNVMGEAIAGIENYLIQQGFSSVKDIVGLAHED